MKSGILLVLLSVTAGCKANRWREHDVGKSAEPAAAPKLVDGADATVATPGPAFDLDDKSGHAKSELVLRLDFFPEARPGGTILPVCYDPFEPNFDLGSVMCDGKPETKVALTAGMLTQECYTHPETPKVPPSKALTLAGCKRGMVLAHAFSPKLRIDVESKDVAASAVAPAPTP